jgi:hypothetical protein
VYSRLNMHCLCAEKKDKWRHRPKNIFFKCSTVGQTAPPPSPKNQPPTVMRHNSKKTRNRQTDRLGSLAHTRHFVEFSCKRKTTNNCNRRNSEENNGNLKNVKTKGKLSQQLLFCLHPLVLNKNKTASSPNPH